jgi:2-polyprenyl-6-methoxyphenol hydroxylase-like FAD-dependent oxidoreductase
MSRNAIVAGGGIGGLAAALALLRRDWKVEVLERAAAFEEVGAGLSVWPNALRALDALGPSEKVRAQAIVETQAGVRDRSGRWLARTDTEELARRYGPLVMIHRAELLDLLRTAVPADSLRPGVEVTRVANDRTTAEVTHTAGVSRADLVVGADGIRSAVRRSVWPDAPQPRYAGYTAWRVVAGLGEPISSGGETWGRGERFGIAPLPDGRVYGFAVANRPAGERVSGGELADLRRRFADWHDPIPALLEAASEEAVLRSDIEELPPLPTYVGGGVALLGDAAHAMTPNLGQGAGQALEDAVTLAACLDAHPSTASALAAYDAERRPRTQRIARRSRRIGVIAQWSAPPAVALRDAAMRITPSAAQLRSLAPILTWSPPAS